VSPENAIRPLAATAVVAGDVACAASGRAGLDAAALPAEAKAPDTPNATTTQALMIAR
jgi:hypothetical protein